MNIEERVRSTVDALAVHPVAVGAVVAAGERRRKRARTAGAALVTVGVVILVAILSQVLAGAPSDRAVPPTTQPSTENTVERPIELIPLGQRGAPIDLTGVSADGTALDVADFRGEIVLVPFWGSWCRPCQESVAAIDEVGAGSGVAVLGVALDGSSADAFRAAEAAAAVSFDSILNPSEEMLRGLGEVRPRGVPTTLVLDPEGRVAATAVGAVPATELTRAIALLELQQAADSAGSLPNLLTVRNDTDEPLWVTFSNGSRAEVKPGRQFQLGSLEACSSLPLTATTLDGDVVATFDEPCAGQTWSISPAGTRSDSTVTVPVFYVDAGGTLVTRESVVDAYGDRVEDALALAGTTPAEAGLRNAFPADAFASASVDGYGRHGQVSVSLRDATVGRTPSNMSDAEARLAIRAAACTAQLGADTRVVFYLGTEPAPSLFGVPLTDGEVSDADCPL